MLDLRSLHHFLAVVEHSSFGRAAEELGLTQSAVSKSVKRLEELLRVQLLERGPGGVRPTVFGSALIEHARTIEVEMRSVSETMDALRGARKGNVTVGAGPSILAAVIAPAAVRLIERYPNVRVTAIEGMVEPLIPALKRGEIDFTVGSGDIEGDHADLVALPLFEDRIVIVAGSRHPLRARGMVRLADLLEYPWVLPFPDELFSKRCDQLFRRAGLPPPVPAITTNSAACIRTMLADSVLLSFLPRQSITREEASGLLAPLEVEDGSWRRRAHILRRRRGTLSPAARALIIEIRAVCERDADELAITPDPNFPIGDRLAGIEPDGWTNVHRPPAD